MRKSKKIHFLIISLLCLAGCGKENPTVEPTVEPTIEPTQAPTVEPTIEPTPEPTEEPTIEPTQAPTVEPTEKPTEEPVVNGSIDVLQCEGYEEGLYVNFAKVMGAISYEVTYALSDSEEISKVDSMLIREYQDYMRVDILGLKKGSYKVSILPILAAELHVEKTIVENIYVTSHNREGFAFSNNQVPGAYNLDGTLKNNAVVLYLTEQTKDTMSLEVTTSSKGSKETFVGLQNILSGFKKGYDSRPLCIRIIGKVTDLSVLEGGDIVIDGNRKYKAGVTLEGIGNDAVAYGWGIRLKNISNVEVRNLATMAVDSKEGDNIGLQQDNEYIWIHDNDFFYGAAGGDSDQAKGDGALDCKKSNYVTMSYNHFYDSGKANLLGNNGGEVGYLITYHHNWYDHSDSRHPRVREYSAHVYNNYYDGNSKYGIGNTQGGSVFSEANYFRNCKYPMLISMQGTDVYNGAEGTFSKEDGGIIKSFNNYIEGAKRFVTYQENQTDFDAYEVSDRNEKVPSDVITKKGSHTYDNFDTNETIMYKYEVQTPQEAKEDVIAKAGRLDGGDFKWTFTSDEDNSYDVNKKLKEAIFNYESAIISIGFEVNNSDEENNENNDNKEESGEVVPPTVEGSIIHSFTESGLNSDVFEISGNLSTSKGTVIYNSLTLTKCLKIESSTSITFKTNKTMTLTLVFNDGCNSNIYVDNVKRQINNGVLTLTLQAGDHYIKKADSVNLYYIELIEEK